MMISELKIVSQEFRRRSSALLRSDSDNAAANITRFKQYIDTTPVVRDIITKTIADVDYSFKDCFPTQRTHGWAEISIPFDEASHVKAQYDYLSYIVDETGSNVLGQSMMYYHSSRKYDDMIEEFLRMAFEPLISYIVAKLTEEMIALDKDSATPVIQNNIHNLNGTLAQGNTIDVHNTTNVTTAEIDNLLSLLNKARDIVEKCQIDEEIKENVIDDIDVIQEQVNLDTPRKSRVAKALKGVKQFSKEFVMKLGVSVAASAVMGYDWSGLVQQIEAYFHL